MQPFAKILVPVDLSSFSAKAVSYAARLAGEGGSLTLLTVISDVLPYFDFFPIEYPSADYFEAMKTKAEAELRTLADEHAKGVSVQTIVRRGYPAAEIVEMAAEEKFDLIVMATHGHSGLEHALLGSITEKVLRKAHCPVLVAR
jgi:nucleotide-binding universal stress UspA family protein